MFIHRDETFISNFKRFFWRGLAILLPSVLTIWILLAAYQFVQQRIAEPINRGVREVIIRSTEWPVVTLDQIKAYETDLEKEVGAAEIAAWRKSGKYPQMRELATRRAVLRSRWRDSWLPLDLIGLFVAVVLIYMAGGILGSFIGRSIYARGERLLARVPLIRNVYPSVKQVTDFFVGEASERLKISRVVAVEYPRKGLWSIGLVTGDTLQAIQDRTGVDCVTIFVPSSPTPFTGYVITVPKEDTIDLPITIEDALQFTISGGVIVPTSQRIPGSGGLDQPRRGSSAAPKLPPPQPKS